MPEPVPDPEPFLTLTPSATVIELAPGESGEVSVTFDFLGADQVDWSAVAAFAPHLSVAADTTGVTDTGSGRGLTISLHSIPIGGEPLAVTITATSPDEPGLQASVVITVNPIIPTILVLLYLDHQIPLTDLRFALPDQYCGDVQYHALVPPTATSLAGVEVTQPDPMGCGFGASTVVIEEIPGSVGVRLTRGAVIAVHNPPPSQRLFGKPVSFPPVPAPYARTARPGSHVPRAQEGRDHESAIWTRTRVRNSHGGLRRLLDGDSVRPGARLADRRQR